MTKSNAILTLIDESRNRRITKASYKRVQKALDVLEVPASERVNLEQWLEFRDMNGNLHNGLESKKTGGAKL